ncbi:MAG: hypothetical protein QG603_438 [Patescibacteria group bacterium]|nr:hypothetical protein [Patescibacteria group bacterium]MDQ5970661.1 hypothetical protein [Patescibacteria group bacterium]
MKKLFFMVMVMTLLLSASTVLARQYAGRYSSIFDLNSDQSVNLSDVAQVSSWLQADSHQHCYAQYQTKLAMATSTSQGTNFAVSDSWCSSLLGLLMDAMRTQSYNAIVDLNSDGKLNLLDVSLMATWYHNDYGEVCYSMFTKSFDSSDIHWCAAAYQGIVDTMGEVAGGPDLAIDYIQVTPEQPVLNEVAEIKIQARNTGTTNITNQAVINNIYKVFGNFTTAETVMPQVSASDPIIPGEEFYYVYKGKFTKMGNGNISFSYNPRDTDEELNVSNNSATVWVTVLRSSLMNISVANVNNITTKSARIYWQSAGMGTNGEYRYSANQSELNNLPWRTDAVSNDPNFTGNAFASQIDLTGLSANTKYYIQLRKYYQGTLAMQYSITKELNFKTLNNADENDDLPQDGMLGTKLKVCHETGNTTKITIEISQDAVATHLAHGDKLGACDLETVQPVSPVSTKLIERVRGRILLQVESHGEAWYVNPKNDGAYYLKDGSTAYTLMREAGLGITNTDLAKIPVGFEDRFSDADSDSDGLADKLESGLGTDPSKPDTDGDGVKDKAEILAGTNPLGVGALARDNSLVNRLLGRIVLQVESRGEAWYIDPSDGKRYYMRDGEAAYQIMRFRSLGISNSDLSKITR